MCYNALNMADSDTIPDATDADSPLPAGDAPPQRRFMEPKAGDAEGRALTLKAVPGMAAVSATDAGRLPLLLEVRGRALRPGAKRPPLNIALAIDRSAAMAGEPLEYAKRACAYVVDLLEPDDFLSIVAVEAEADIVLPARRVRDKALVKDYVQRLTTGRTADLGAGFLGEGLLAACRQAASVRSPRMLSRVLLLTEGGAALTGPAADRLRGQVAEQKARGLTVSTFGVGTAYSEGLLSALAWAGGGSFNDVPRPERIPEAFRREMEAAGRTVAAGVRLRLLVSRGVSVREASGHAPFFGPRSAEVGLVDVEGGSGVASQWELELAARPPGTYRVAVAELLYDDARTGRQEKVSADVVVEFAGSGGASLGAGMDGRVQAEREIAQAGVTLNETLAALRGGRLDRTGALDALKETKTLMLDRGRLAQAQRITQAMQEIEASGAVEKTLTATVTALAQGRMR